MPERLGFALFVDVVIRSFPPVSPRTSLLARDSDVLSSDVLPRTRACAFGTGM